MSIILPCTLSLGYFLVERFILKRKYPAYFYLFVFTLIFSLFAFSAHSREHNPENKMDGHLTPQQRDLFFHLCESEIRQGHFRLNCAENMSIFIPNFEHRQLTKDVLRNLITTLPISDLKLKGITIAIMFLSTYLEGVYDQWDAVKYELEEAAYHFEMAEFYQDILFYDTGYPE